MLFEAENISVNAMQMNTDPAAEFHALFASAVQYL
jgi:hypothetical protein